MYFIFIMERKFVQIWTTTFRLNIIKPINEISTLRFLDNGISTLHFLDNEISTLHFLDNGISTLHFLDNGISNCITDINKQ